MGLNEFIFIGLCLRVAFNIFRANTTKCAHRMMAWALDSFFLALFQLQIVFVQCAKDIQFFGFTIINFRRLKYF
jgi:hypothetical protein